MFNPDFFPTSDEVIDKMLAPLSETYDTSFGYDKTYLKYRYKILEPSAGKGNILDRIVSHYNAKKNDICCIEIEPELSSILVDKGYRVIDTDFLKYDQPYIFGLIVMNPPFSKGVTHLLKAWEVLSEGTVVCLLNAESIRNPYTAERQHLLTLIEEHGSYEFIGAAFKDAERTTNVECVIVWLNKESKSNTQFNEDGFDRDEARENSEYVANPLASASMVQSLVDQFNQAVKLLVSRDKDLAQLLFYTNGIVRWVDTRSKNDLNTQIDELKAGFWEHVFLKTGVGAATTSSFMEDFQRFSTRTSNLAFTVDNIMLVLEHFVLNSEQIMKDCVISVFDQATSYHEKNAVHPKGEGWKTNKSWKIAPKIIMPDGVDYDTKWGNWHIDRWGKGNFYRDIDKVLCYLTGKKIEKIVQLHKAIDERCDMLSGHHAYEGRRERYDKEFDTEFFRVRFFKKGTVHLTFKDSDMLAIFNRAAAQGKNWVGGGKGY